jgi:hypothetical protein
MTIGQHISREESDPMTGIGEKSGIELKNRKSASWLISVYFST